MEENQDQTKQWLINEIKKPVEEKINIDFNLDHINYVLDLIEEFKENNENYLNPVEADFFDEEESLKSSTELENIDFILEKLATHENAYIREEVAKRGYHFFNQNKENVNDIYNDLVKEYAHDKFIDNEIETLSETIDKLQELSKQNNLSFDRVYQQFKADTTEAEKNYILGVKEKNYYSIEHLKNPQKKKYQIEDIVNEKETLLEATARISLNVLGNIKPLENFVNKQIIPNTKQYKDLVDELKTKPSERFYMDGERSFSDIEKRMLKVFNESTPKKIKIYDEVKKNNLIQKENLPTQKINFVINKELKTKIEKMDKQQQEKYLQDKIKYLGFGENEDIKNQLKKGMEGNNKEFTISLKSDRVQKGNSVDFTLNFNKSEKGGVFLNSFKADLKDKRGNELSHTFKNNFTAKEAINLLEGRSVKKIYVNKEEKQEEVFVKINFNEPKDRYNNYKFNYFNKEKYGVDTEKIVDNSNIVFSNPEYKENVLKSLEKGNIVQVKIKKDNEIIDGKAVLNPQYKNISLYDSKMNRINTNKPLKGLESAEGKNNAIQQKTKRSL